MKLFNDFLKFSQEQGISLEDIYQEKGDEYSMVSFGEQGKEDVIYNVTLVFYNDDVSAEIYIRKQIDTEDLLSVLQQINRLNSEYSGMTFFLDDGILSLKSLCLADGDIETVLYQMVQNIEIAEIEFVEFQA